MTNGADPAVVIIGGGYAGISAAVSLAERGIRTTLFESGKAAGGRARRVEYRGEVIDNGQHILSGAYRELLRLMSVVGVSENAVSRIPLTLSMPPDFSLTAPRLVAPFHMAWALLSAKGLTLSDRFSAIRFMQSLKKARFKVNDAQSVASLLAANRQSERLVKYLWQPLTISALNTPITSASAQVFANVLCDALASRRDASDLILPRTDLSSLFPEAAARWLSIRRSEVHCGIRVKSLKFVNGKFQTTTDEGESNFDAAIIAVGPHQFGSLALPADINPGASFLYEPIVTIYLRFAERIRLPHSMIGQAEGIVHWFFDRRQLSDGAADLAGDGGLIAAVISASGRHETFSQEELAACALEELARHTGPLPAPLWQKVIVEKFATFACTAPIQAKRPSSRTNCTGLFVAGDYTAGDYPATLEGAARSGIAAADHVQAYLSNSKISCH